MEHNIKSAVIAAIAAVTNDVNDIEKAADIATAQIMRDLKNRGARSEGILGFAIANLECKLNMVGNEWGWLIFISDEEVTHGYS